jgi:hypothetical protein
LLGLPTAEGGRAYPIWQFNDDGTLVPHIADVIKILASGTTDPWTWAAWLAARTPERFGDSPAWQWLASGRNAETVLAAARADAARWTQ